jgi:hypothetical protein
VRQAVCTIRTFLFSSIFHTFTRESGYTGIAFQGVKEIVFSLCFTGRGKDNGAQGPGQTVHLDLFHMMEQIIKFLTSPEGMAMVQQFIGTPQGKPLAGQLLVPIRENPGVPETVSQSLQQYVPE